MPPGFVNPCPAGLTLPLTQWVMVAWIVSYALGLETLAVGLRALVFRLRQTGRYGATPLLLVVAGCTAGSVALAVWMTNRNLQSCSSYDIPAHITPAIAAQVAQSKADLAMQAHLALGLLAALLVLATTLTAATLVRGWRQRRRARVGA